MSPSTRIWPLKWLDWRRSEKVDDYRDPNKPVEPDDLTDFYTSINEMIQITNSDLANDLGGQDIEVPKDKSG